MPFVMGLALIAIATMIGVLMRSDDPDLGTLGKSVVFYLGALPSLLFGILIVLMHWPEL